MRLLASRLPLDTNENVIGAAEFLKRHLAKPELAQTAAEGSKVSRTFGRNLHLDPALEVHAVVEPGCEEQDDRRDGKEERDTNPEEPCLHEPDLRAIRNQVDG